VSLKWLTFFLLIQKRTICIHLSFVWLPICESSSTMKVIPLCTRGCDVVCLFVVGDCEDQYEVLWFPGDDGVSQIFSKKYYQQGNLNMYDSAPSCLEHISFPSHLMSLYPMLLIHSWHKELLINYGVTCFNRTNKLARFLLYYLPPQACVCTLWKLFYC
jgi:hypothetical protein